MGRGSRVGVALLLACACSERAPAGTAPTDADGNAVKFQLDGLGPDLAAEVDATLPDLSLADIDAAPTLDAQPACPANPGCACIENGDCDNGLCIEAGDGAKACATLCADKCPAGQTCAQVTAPNGDVVSVCVAKAPHLCNPCATSQDCGSLGIVGAACVDHAAAGRFCGVACTSPEHCPAGYACKTATSVEGLVGPQCVPGNGAPCACSGQAKKLKLVTACHVEVKAADGTVVGKCPGTRACGADGLSACLATSPTAETCNGSDDDCDGATDETACEDGNPCTTDTCAAGLACTHTPADGLPCNADGSDCTVGDACAGGACKAGPVKDCSDGNPCTFDSCNLASGCTHTNDDGVACDDDNPCTVDDTCAGSACKPGMPKSCTVDQPCTAGLCDLTSGTCKFGPAGDGVACNDGSACTSKDACGGGTCKGASIDCDDGNGCTNDACAVPFGCTHTATAASCDDGNACTVGDSCVPSPNGVAACAAGQVKPCEDANPCTADACDPLKGCTYAPKPGDTGPCYAGPPATKNVGACKAGVQTCDEAGKLSPCNGQTVPSLVEACDGADDDCDGQTDEVCAPTMWTFGSVPVVVTGKQGVKSVEGSAGVGLVGTAGGKIQVRWLPWQWLTAPWSKP